jgi:hypothetical protein
MILAMLSAVARIERSEMRECRPPGFAALNPGYEEVYSAAVRPAPPEP